MPNAAILAQLAAMRYRACRAVRSRHYSTSIPNLRPSPYPTVCSIMTSTDSTMRRSTWWSSDTTTPRMRAWGTHRITHCVTSGMDGGRIWCVMMWNAVRSREPSILRDATRLTRYSPVRMPGRASMWDAQTNAVRATQGRIQETHAAY